MNFSIKKLKLGTSHFTAMGFAASTTSFIIRRHCLVFWGAIVVSLGSMGGVIGFGPGKIFADASEDWMVTGVPAVDQMDMVRLATEATETNRGLTHVAERAQWLYEVAQSGDVAVRSAIGFYVAPDALSLNQTKNTRSMIPLGSPVVDRDGATVEPYKAGKHEAFSNAVRERLFVYFGMVKGMAPWRKKAETADLEVRFLSPVMVSGEFDTLMNSDVTMVVGLLFFVIFYICFHTGSLGLGLIGMVMILLSLPLAIFCSGSPFAMVHVLAVFVVLGLNRNDIFVFADAWRQSALMDPEVSGSLTHRMKFAYVRTAQAVFNTSFTTAVAFIATGAYSVMPIAAFGYYAAIAIVMNYLLAVTFLPAAFIIWEVYFRKARLVGCCFHCVRRCALRLPETSLGLAADAPTEAKECKTGAEGKQPALTEQFAKPGRVEHFFHNVYAPALTYSLPRQSSDKRFKPVSLFLVFGLAALGAVLAAQAIQLTSPTVEVDLYLNYWYICLTIV